jgi:hypothetical protein
VRLRNCLLPLSSRQSMSTQYVRMCSRSSWRMTICFAIRARSFAGLGLNGRAVLGLLPS